MSVWQRGLRAFSLGIALLFIIALEGPAGAFAAAPSPQGTDIHSFVQRDLNGDSVPDTATIVATYRGRRYRVEVYDRRRNMRWADSWQVGTDFSDDVWVFKTEADNVARFILRFNHDDTGYTAELFDDVDGNGSVSYQLPGGSQVKITEATFPTVKMEADKYWILPDGLPNRNVHITCYRPMTSGTGEVATFEPRLFHDGRPALEQEVVDSNGDGVPDYELVRAYYNVPIEWNVFRTFLLVNTSQRPLASFTDYFLWPFLGYADGNDRQEETNFWRIPQDQAANTIPPIHVDWDHSRIRGVAHFLPLWGLGDQWRLQSWVPLVKGDTNALDWERFAYYSYSGNANPDMVVRLRQGYRETVVHAGAKELHPENVAISWKNRNPGTLFWDFKLDLAGLHELPATEVAFPDFSLREVPFAQYPTYYADQGWAYATLVATEGPPSPNNEGIGEWSTLHGVHVNEDLPYDLNVIPDSETGQLKYLVGDSPISPAAYYKQIKEGLRGEYGDLDGRQARLYMSAIDHKLHMLHAQFGVWNLGAGSEIRYQNLGGNYLNQWALLQNGKTLQSMRYLAGQLILDQADAVRITPLTIDEAAFTSAPPRSQQEWSTLGNQVAGQSPSFDPADFAAMSEQFGRSGLTLAGASLRDFRSTGDGFRFVLTLKPGFTLAGPDLLSVRGLLPGDYIVTYRGAFSVQPASAPQLSLKVTHDPVGDQMPAINQPDSLLATVGNGGSEDAGVVVRIRPVRPGQQLAWSEPQTVTVQAGATVPLRFTWIPSAAGDWQVQAEARLLDTPGVVAKPVTATTQAHIRPASQTSLGQDVTAFGLVAGWQLGLLLGSLLLVGGVLGWRVFAALGEPRVAGAPAGRAEAEDR